MFGARAGRSAAHYSHNCAQPSSESAINQQAEQLAAKTLAIFDYEGSETIPGIRDELNAIMERGAGIYRRDDLLLQAMESIKTLKVRYLDINLDDKSKVYNTDWIQALELGAMIDVAQAMVISALERKESRGSHQRLDHTDRDDTSFLKHSLAHYRGQEDPELSYRDVVITKSMPAERVYGGAAS